MEKTDRELLIEVLAKVGMMEKRLDSLQIVLQREYKDLERRLGKAENNLVALQTKIAVLGGAVVVLTPLITYLLNL